MKERERGWGWGRGDPHSNIVKRHAIYSFKKLFQSVLKASIKTTVGLLIDSTGDRERERERE